MNLTEEINSKHVANSSDKHMVWQFRNKTKNKKFMNNLCIIFQLIVSLIGKIIYDWHLICDQHRSLIIAFIYDVFIYLCMKNKLKIFNLFA